jgi:uncharacterized membrane protein
LVVDVAVRVNGICLVVLFLIFIALDVIIIVNLGVWCGRIEHGFESFVCDESMERIRRAGVIAWRDDEMLRSR